VEPLEGVKLKRMSDDRQSWLILSANKIGQEKYVICHTKIRQFSQPIKSSNFIIQHRTCSILDDKISQLFGYRSTDFVYVSMVTVYGGR